MLTKAFTHLVRGMTDQKLLQEKRTLLTDTMMQPLKTWSMDAKLWYIVVMNECIQRGGK